MPMHQIKSLGVIQTSKVMGAIYFILGLFSAALAAIVAVVTGGGASLLLALALPFLYGLLGFVGTTVMCRLYNWVAKYLGGIEIEVSAE